MSDVFQVEILPERHFGVVLNVKAGELVLYQWHPTVIKNLDWCTWLVIKIRWPFIKVMKFFEDSEAGIFYPEKGSWLERQAEKGAIPKLDR